VEKFYNRIMDLGGEVKFEGAIVSLVLCKWAPAQ